MAARRGHARLDRAHEGRQIRYRPSELQAVVDHEVRAFCLTNANLRASVQAERYLQNLERITLAAKQPGPYIYGVYENAIRKIWPRHAQAL